MISCPEEIALRMGHISQDEPGQQINMMEQNSYRAYLDQLIKDDPFPFINNMNS